MEIRTKKAMQFGEGALRDGTMGNRVVTTPGQTLTVGDDIQKDPFFKLAFKAGDVEILLTKEQLLTDGTVAANETLDTEDETLVDGAEDAEKKADDKDNETPTDGDGESAKATTAEKDKAKAKK